MDRTSIDSYLFLNTDFCLITLSNLLFLKSSLFINQDKAKKVLILINIYFIKLNPFNAVEYRNY